MLKILSNLILTSFLLFTYACQNTVQEETDQRMVLFSEGADDWITVGPDVWTYEADTLIGRIDTGTAFVVTTEAYTNFKLSLEFYPDSTINSGIFVRCENQIGTAADCYEFNIWDLHPNQDYRTGALVTHTSPLAQVHTLNQWNTYELEIRGNQLSAKVNGQLCIQTENTKSASGYIALQAGGQGTIKFRNVQLTPLPEK